MKKYSFPLLIVLIFALMTSANAQSVKVPGNGILLSFNGTKACCDITITADDYNGDISAVIELSDGNSCINSWEATGKGYLYFFDDTTTVVKGRSYVLTVNYTINGESKLPLTTSGVCRNNPFIKK